MSWFDRFAAAVCGRRERLLPMLAVLSLMGVLLVFAFPFLEPGTTAYALALLDAILLVVGFAFVTGTYWYCSKWAMEQ